MSALITDCKKIGANAWRYEWSGTAPFWAMVRGRYVLQSSDDTSIVVQWDDDTDHAEPPMFEVIDSTQDVEDMQQILHPPCPTIQFRGRTTNSYYIISESIDGGAWANIATVIEDGRGYYTVSVSARPPISLRYRVTAYDVQGSAGAPLNFSFFHSTNPDLPAFTLAYDAGTGEVTVS